MDPWPPHLACKAGWKAILGSDPVLVVCRAEAIRLAPTEQSLLICGETGTGKELLARIIHRSSRRAPGPFVVVDCAHPPPSGQGPVFEALVLGRGRGGTVFLDGLTEMEPGFGQCLLAALRRKQREAGAGLDLPFRLLASSQMPPQRLASLSGAGPELLRRLAFVVIHLPPLRHRRQDVPELARHFIAASEGRRALGEGFMEALQTYPWPGNVRELISSIERALAAARGHSRLVARHLPAEVRLAAVRSRLGRPCSGLAQSLTPERGTEAAPTLADLRRAVFGQAERLYLQSLLGLDLLNLHHACSLSGLSPSRLYALLKKHHLCHPPMEF